MTNLTRAQSLEMWKLVAQGALRSTDHAQQPMNEMGNVTVMEFIERVAVNILKADECGPTSRLAQLVIALGLQGKMHDTEMEIRRAIGILCDFHDGVTAVDGQIELSAQAMQSAVNQLRSRLGYHEITNPDQKDYQERSRQVREFLKHKRI
jgi:hypothetical protein